VWVKAHLTLYANVSLVLHGFQLPISYAARQNGSWVRMNEAEHDAVDLQ
jgi:hypothetical protein